MEHLHRIGEWHYMLKSIEQVSQPHVSLLVVQWVVKGVMVTCIYNSAT